MLIDHRSHLRTEHISFFSIEFSILNRRQRFDFKPKIKPATKCANRSNHTKYTQPHKRYGKTEQKSWRIKCHAYNPSGRTIGNIIRRRQ